MFEETAGFANDGAELELDRFEMRVDPFPALGLQSTEELIAPRAIYNFGHVCHPEPPI